jgi:cell division septation protein DedD
LFAVFTQYLVGASTMYFEKTSIRRSGFLSTVAVIAALAAGAVSAQALRDTSGPAEFPPASFTANQYVDSRGCVFVRAGIGGATEWVPRVSRSREQLCGFAPTRVAAASPTAPRANVPNPLDTPVAGLEARAPAPTVAPGFQPVWDDGRLNTQRGIRRGPQTQSPSGMTGSSVRYATAPRPQAVQAQTPRVATRTGPQTTQRTEQLSGHRYVQVGTFATRSQAQSVAQSLRARGLPMRIGVFNQNGQEMRMVLAGPFGSDNQLQGALGTARGAGFSGAFTRR